MFEIHFELGEETPDGFPVIATHTPEELYAAYDSGKEIKATFTGGKVVLAPLNAIYMTSASQEGVEGFIFVCIHFKNSLNYSGLVRGYTCEQISCSREMDHFIYAYGDFGNTVNS